MKLNITEKGIENAVNSRNAVLLAMGFEIEEVEVEEIEEVEVEEIEEVGRYGRVIATEIQHNVFEVAYEKQELYLSDIKSGSVRFLGDK